MLFFASTYGGGHGVLKCSFFLDVGLVLFVGVYCVRDAVIFFQIFDGC